MSRASWHYFHQPRAKTPDPVPHTQRRSDAWLCEAEQDQIAGYIEAAYRQGWSVYQAFCEALDAGDPVASLASWYRIERRRVAAARPVRKRRKHRASALPSLVATAPMQAWTWDITHLKGPYVRVSYQLYAVIDVFSRKIVTWRVETCEDDDLAKEMFDDAFAACGAQPRIVHSDGGPSMTSNTVTGLFAKLGIEVSKNRPRVSNDNPYSEAWFKTAKYAPAYPAYFTDIAQARAWASDFVDWYNHHHRHSSLEGHTPASVHDGSWRAVHHRRVATMDTLYRAHPARFHRPPVVKTPMAHVAINHPISDQRLQTG